MSCPLCKRKKKTELYYELIWVASCSTCHVPMVVLKRHTTDPTPFEVAWLESHLRKIGEEVFGKGKFRIDRKQRLILDHIHYHARLI